VSTPVEDFAARLRALRKIAGQPSYLTLATLTKDTKWPQSKSKIYDKLKPNGVSDEEFVMGFVLACVSFASARGRTLPSELTDLARWRQDAATVRREAALMRKARLDATRKPGAAPTAATSTDVVPSPQRQRELLAAYLEALCAEISILRPGAIRGMDLPLELQLDEVYIELQAERDHPDIDRRVTAHELAEDRKQDQNWSWEDKQRRERQYRISADRERPSRAGAAPQSSAVLASVIDRHDQVVILGGPGSGKTTLLRHLALQSAQFLLNSPEPPADVARVPIYVRISAYAEFRAVANPDLALRDYLSHYVNGLQVRSPADVTALLYRSLDEGRCLILLDGLDEVIEDRDRANVARAIAQFAAVYRGNPAAGHAAQGAGPERPPGNKLAVTSRLAGYRSFVELPSSFGHYTIRPLSRPQVESFLDRWFLAVEKRLKPDAAPQVIEQQVARQRDKILDAIEHSPGVARLTDSPLMLRLLAMLQIHETNLPRRRVELYFKAANWLLYEWHLERGAPPEAAIDERVTISLLGPVAMHIHTRRPSGLLSLGQMEQLLFEIRGPQRGDPPDAPSVETIADVRRFLRTIREHSGLLVERGAGMIGFVHLTFQEYFVARYLMNRDGHVDEIKARLHQPRWREPVLLAVAFLDMLSGDIDRTLLMILDAGSEHEAILHRDLLFAADCAGDCGVFPMRRKDIARRLIAIYCDADGAGRYALLRRQIQDALRLLSDSADSWAVEAALADELRECRRVSALSRAAEIADLLGARSPAVIQALREAPALLPEVRQALTMARRRALAAATGTTPPPPWRGWRDYRDDRRLAQTIGALWLFGWRDFTEIGLGAPSEPVGDATTGAEAEDEWTPVTRLRGLAWYLETCATNRKASVTLVASELTEVIGELRFAGRADARFTQLADLARKIRGWYERPGSRLSNRTLAQLLDVLTSRASDVSSQDQDAARLLLTGQVLSGIQLLRRGRPLTHGQSHRLASAQQLLAHRLGPDDTTLRPNSPDGESWGPDALDDLTRRLEDALAPDLPDLLDAWGRAVLTHAQFGDAVAEVVAGALRDACPLLAATDAQGWRLVAESAGSAMIDVLLRLLRSTTDPRQYLEAAFLLARVGQPEICEPELRSVIATDLDGDTPERALSALRALRDPPVRHIVALPDECGRLTGLADRRPDLADAALDVLFASGLSPVLLAWCLARLRDAGPELTETLRTRLDAVRVVSGTTPMLCLIDEGLAGHATRAVARGLLRKVAWTGLETYVQCLNWLQSADPDARGVAGLLLIRDGRLFDVPQLELRDAVRTQLEAMASPLPVSWASLRANPEAMLLLKSLWAHGWRDALILLWLDEPMESYVRRSHPDLVAADPEVAVSDVLGQARFGQALIPMLLAAADYLADLHRARDGSAERPHTDDVAVVRQRIARQLAEITADFAGDPRTPLEADAAILYAALRGRPIAPPTDVPLLAMLASDDSDDGADDGDDADADDGMTWFWAANRLAGISAPRVAVQETVAAALNGRSPRRLGLALLILMMNPSLFAVMRAALADELRRPGLDPNRGLLIAHLLASADPDDDVALSWLRALVPQQHPSSAEHAARSAATLAQRMMSSDRPQARAVAAAQLLAGDLYALLLPVLAQAAMSSDSQLRWVAENWLYALNEVLPTDGSSASVDWLYRQRTSLESAYGRSEDGAGHRGTVIGTAVGAVSHTDRYWLSKWLATIDLDGADEDEFRHASLALDAVSNASDEVIGWLCTRLTEPGHSEIVRRATAFVLGSIRHESASRMADPAITAALLRALDDRAPTVRRAAASALQWTLHDVEEVTGALLRHAESDPDQEVGSLALVSLGRVLRRAEELPEAVAEPLLRRMRVLMSEADPVISRAAAGGIAVALQGRDEVIATLAAFLPGRNAVLSAMLLGAADTDPWDEEAPSHHVGFISRTAAWINEQPEAERAELIDLLLSDLERAAAGMEEEQRENILDVYTPRWATRRITVGVLAELSERLTYHSFTWMRTLAEVVSLLVRVAKEPDSYNSRRFALKILGNLQRFTPEVAAAFLGACQDADPVYRDSKSVIGKFNDFAAGSFEKLTEALFDPDDDASVAYRAAALLGLVGTGRSVELGSGGRSQIGAELARFLADPLADRIAVEPVENEGLRRLHLLGPVYDAAYEALIKVVAGPDAPDFEAADSSEFISTSEVVWQQPQETSAELQEILQQLGPGGQPTGGANLGPRVRVFWKDGSPAPRYCISVYNHEHWIGGVTYVGEHGYHKLFLRPPQDRALSGDNVIVISAEGDLQDSGVTVLPGMVRDLPGMQLVYDDVFNSGVVIGLPDAAVQELSHATDGSTLRVYVEPPTGIALNASNIVVGRESDFYVSLPHWENAIERVSYTVEDGRLNIIVKSGDEGLKLLRTDVQFTQGIGYAGLPEPDIGKLRRRKGRGAMQLIVSLPHPDDAFERISYRLQENLLHIIVRTNPSFWPLNTEDIEFRVVPPPDQDQDEAQESDGGGDPEPSDDGHRIRIFWRDGSPGQNYQVAIYNDEQWACEISYAAEDGCHKLLLRPPQDPPASGGSLIVIGPEDGVAGSGSGDRDTVALAETLRADPGVQLCYDEAFNAGVVIGIPEDALEQLSQVSAERLTRILLQPRAGRTLQQADVTFGRENDLYISFPYWPDSIASVSYTIEDDRLNVNVKPGEGGLKLKDSDVRFSRGIGYSRLADPGTGKLRRRKGRGALQFTVSLPYRADTVEKVSYKVEEDFLHIILRATQSFWPLSLDDVSFRTMPLAHEEAQQNAEAQHDGEAE
jgi:NACHT domain/HEAT repeats